MAAFPRYIGMKPHFLCLWKFYTFYTVSVYLGSISEVNELLNTFSTHRDVLVSVNFGCFALSRFSHLHCNAMRKAIKAP